MCRIVTILHATTTSNTCGDLDLVAIFTTSICGDFHHKYMWWFALVAKTTTCICGDLHLWRKPPQVHVVICTCGEIRHKNHHKGWKSPHVLFSVEAMFIVILHGASNRRNSHQYNSLHISHLLCMDPCCSPAPFTSNDSICPARQNTIPISISIKPLGGDNEPVTFWVPYFFQKSPIFIVAFIPLTAILESEWWGVVGEIGRASCRERV